MPTFAGLSAETGIPADDLVHYALVRWASAGAEALMSLDPQVLDELVSARTREDWPAVAGLGDVLGVGGVGDLVGTVERRGGHRPGDALRQRDDGEHDQRERGGDGPAAQPRERRGGAAPADAREIRRHGHGAAV